MLIGKRKCQWVAVIPVTQWCSMVQIIWRKTSFGGYWGKMKANLEERARGSPVPGIPNHHLPQALPWCLTSPVSWGLHLVSKQQYCLWKHIIYVSIRSAKPPKSTWHSLGVLSHSAFLTIGSYQNGMNLNNSLFTLSTKLLLKYVWALLHVPHNTDESQRTKLDSVTHLLCWRRSDHFTAFCCVC